VRGRAAEYGLAFIFLAIAVVIRWLLDPLLGDLQPLSPLGGAVAAAVWVGGYRPAILVSLLGYAIFSYLFIQTRGTILPDDVGSAVGLGAYLFTSTLIIVIGDAMRRAQQRAGQRGEVLRITLGSIGDAVITTDVQGSVNYLNAVAERLTGWSNQQAQGKPLEDVFKIVNEDTRQPVESPARRALREGVIVGLANHTVLIKKNGDECPVDDSAAPITDERGYVSGCVLIFRDVSEKRRLESRVAAQLADARFLASIIESSEDAIISKSLDGIIQTWNDAAERLFGYTAEEMIGKHISLIIPPERIAEEDEIIANLKAGRRIEHFETARIGKDGRPIPVALTISPIRDDEGMVTGASKMIRDITARKLADAEREKLVTLVENSGDFIGICDVDGVPSFVNRAGLELVGLNDLDEAKKASVRDFFFPEDQDMIMNEFFPKVQEQGHGEVDVRFRHFKTGEARWMAYKVLAVKDDAGETIFFATVSQDVTERRQLEDNLLRLAADLSQADRRKNEFLAMLAHELRNPLAPISNAVHLLSVKNDANAVASAAEMLERQVGQMTRLVDDLLDMSRITMDKIELRNERVELSPIIDQTVETVRTQYRSMGHELTVSLPTIPVYLNADPTRLAQAIGNLLNNACKFTDACGRISLSLRQEDGNVVLRIKDNGVGIEPEDLPHVFEMFTQVDKSLERSRGGLGIGLTLVKKIVELMGGTIEAHSEGLGRGSEFVIHLPVEETAAQLRRETQGNGTKPATGGRILVVDDNVDGAESLALLLQFSGHETFLAHDGIEAVNAAERVRPDVILLDIGLPSLNGYEACRRIREQPWGKNIALVAVTGWGQEEDRERSSAAGFDTHIVKPVDHDALIKLLSTLLPTGNGDR